MPSQPAHEIVHAMDVSEILNSKAPQLLSREEKLIWILGDMMNAVENYFGAENPKRLGHINSTAIRIIDEVLSVGHPIPRHQADTYGVDEPPNRAALKPDTGEKSAEQIADAVISFLVKRGALDADNEYQAADVINALNDLVEG